MAKVAFAILGISIMLNLSTGLLLEFIPGLSTVDVATQYQYDASGTDDFVVPLQDELQPSGGPVEDQGSAIWRVLDMINIGFITKLLKNVKTYLYGFVIFLGTALQPLLEPSTYDFLFKSGTGVLYILMTLIYVIAGFSFWTSREISGR